MRNRVWMLSAIAMGLILGVTLGLYDPPGHKTSTYAQCAPGAARQLPKDTVRRVNAAQDRYKVPPLGINLASRSLSDTKAASVNVIFLPAYCGYMESLLVSPRAKTAQNPPYTRRLDAVTEYYQGKPSHLDGICISETMPTWTQDPDGIFHLKIDCARVYTWDTWDQKQPTLTLTT